MKAGEVYPIPEQLKRKYIELKQYDEMQCVGSNLEFTLLMSMLDCFLADESTNKIQQLITPKKQYTVSSRQIAEKIQTSIVNERNLLKFYQSVFVSDPQFNKASQFLIEFCNIHVQMFSDQLKHKLIILSKIFLVSFFIFGDLERKSENSRRWILIYQNEKQQYSYIKQFKEDFKPTIRQIEFQQSDFLNENGKIQEKNNIHQKEIKDKIHKKIIIEECKNNERQIIESKQYPSNRILQKQDFLDQNENQSFKDDPKHSIQICMKCKDRPQTSLFINKYCNHSFCVKCIENRISLGNGNSTCLKQDCTQQMDQISAINYYKMVSTASKEKMFEPELKKCNGCGSKNVLKSEQFVNDCQHTYCTQCSIQFSKQTSKDNISCAYFGCHKKINYGNLLEYLKQKKIKFECSKCQIILFREEFYLNQTCAHFICFNCLKESKQKSKNNKTFQYPCPVYKCDEVLDHDSFSKYLQNYQSP